MKLPKSAQGYTKTLDVHLNWGIDGGAAVYDVYDAKGRKMPFAYQYDTREGGLTGFSLPDVNGVLTWDELRAALRTQRGKKK